MVEETDSKTETVEQEITAKNDANEILQSADAGMEQSTDGNNVTELEKKIIRQIEYYFGDFNIKRDKFIKDQIALDDGWITMDTMLNFKRLKALADDKLVIAGALRKSTSGLMEVNEDNTKIRRSKPIPEEDSKEPDRERCIYVKGFPRDIALDEIIEFMEKFGPTESVFMRRFNKTMFKGSCFVTYRTEESAKKFLEAEGLKLKDVEMKKMYKHEYVLMKDAEMKERLAEKQKKKNENKTDGAKEEEQPLEITKAALLDVEGIPISAKREEVKEFFKKFSDVAWIDYEMDSSKARLRFKEEGAATQALEKAKAEGTDGKVMFQDVELTCSVVEGAEEQKHWAEVKKIRQNFSKRGHESSGRRQQNKKPKTDDDNDDSDDAGSDGGDSD